MTKILDCTLRDGGYYTNWDFNSETVDAYIQAKGQRDRYIDSIA